MQDWKIKQEIYHRLNRVHDDDLKDKQVSFTEKIVEVAIRYFNEKNVGWIYPSKSYMVAICYAKWLSEIYGNDPFEYLDDPDLLFNNDPYFVQYANDPKNYHKILNNIGGWDFDQSLGMVPDVREYFEKEFMIETK